MKFLKGPPPPPQRDERRRPPPEDGPGRGPEGRGPDGERRPPPRDDDGFGPPPPPPPKRRRRPDPDDPGLVRLRGLAERDREGTLSATEWEELHGLRQRFKLFPPHSTYRFRLEAARSAARSAQQHGKLDVHVQQYQRRLSDADMDDDAGDARLMLFASYMLAEGGNLPEIRKKLKRDIETIRDPGVRERLQRRPDDLDEATSVLRQTEKSGSEK